MSTATQLGYLGLEVSDLGAWRGFATELLGLTVGEPRSDGALPLRMDERAFRILLSEGPRDDVAFLGWEFADGVALEAATKRLSGAGVPFRHGSAAEIAARGVRAMIMLEDPDGVRRALPRTGGGTEPVPFEQDRRGVPDGCHGHGSRAARRARL
jgi:catechol 2,3-dioxygenase-like lactoylglutathione lyase family enzyme